MRRFAQSAVLLAFVSVAACSDAGSDRHCDNAGSAQLCIVEKGGGYGIEAHGLRPGSTVRPSVNGTPIGTGTTVEADGSLGGGVLGLLGGSEGDLEVTAIARNGAQLRVSVHAR